MKYARTPDTGKYNQPLKDRANAMVISLVHQSSQFGVDDEVRLMEIRSSLNSILKNRPDEGKQVQAGIDKL